jgi:adenosylmethionine-8-amino-7-oxononanoate aminotransferase
LLHYFVNVPYGLWTAQVRQLPDGTTKDVLSVGLACSECFSGPRLANLLKAGFEYEQKVMDQLMAGEFAAPLSTHTSAGVSAELDGFLAAMLPHLPWSEETHDGFKSDDWCCNLQLEGASAVWAAIDMLLQEMMLSTGDKSRKKVAVGATSYHGPPSTSFGSGSPLWTKTYQLTYSVPTPQSCDEEMLLQQFDAFLDEHGDEIGVLVVEPQWGSSQAAFPWPKNLLKSYIQKAQARGIRVLCDEIMCGLGRHGHGTLFVSKAWDLNPDAVTFGKAIGCGVYPLAGAILKRGKSVLQDNKCTAMQSHTYAGSSTRALMTATAVLNELPKWFDTIAELGEEMRGIFDQLAKRSDGLLFGHGQGLMWGCLWSTAGQNMDSEYRATSFNIFKKHCDAVGVLPYYVPNGGFMVTPLLDVDVSILREMTGKFEEALVLTMQEIKWQGVSSAKVDEVIPQ